MVGKKVQQYQFVEKLGAGGMGEIYKALDTRLNRTVAIKVLPGASSGDPERRRRFLQEAQAASALNHPSIIIMHDIISDGDTEYMVMEYVHGKTLNDLIPKGGLRVSHALKFALQISDALAAAHAHGIIHRDLKPANIMVNETGIAKILDFGLAKLTDKTSNLSSGESGATQALTMEGTILGTVSYMSPEQAQGAKIDQRSDIFSFGTVLYEMVTGLRAFEGESSISTLSSILRDDPAQMSKVAPDVPSAVEQLILRCMRKNADQRFQNMREVQSALGALKRESDSGSLYSTRQMQAATSAAAPAPSKIQALAADKKGFPILAGVAAGAAIALMVGGAYIARMRSQPEPTQQTAVAPAPPPAETPQVAPMPANVALNNDMIIEMVKENVPRDVILSQIRFAEETKFELTTQEIIRLTKAGVTGPLIEQMRDPKRALPASAANVVIPTKAVPKPTAETTPAPAAATPTPPPTATSVPPPAEPPKPVAASAPPAIPAPAPPPANAATVNVTVTDALPFQIALAEDIPADADVARPLRFTVMADFRSPEGVIVFPKGTVVTGEVSETPKKKFGFGTGRLSFKLTKADASGRAVNVRALPSKNKDGVTQRPVEVSGRTAPKGVAATAGAQYIGYIDGEQKLTLPVR